MARSWWGPTSAQRQRKQPGWGHRLAFFTGAGRPARGAPWKSRGEAWLQRWRGRSIRRRQQTRRQQRGFPLDRPTRNDPTGAFSPAAATSAAHSPAATRMPRATRAARTSTSPRACAPPLPITQAFLWSSQYRHARPGLPPPLLAPTPRPRHDLCAPPAKSSSAGPRIHRGSPA